MKHIKKYEITEIFEARINSSKPLKRRLQVFFEKGIKCVNCETVGSHFYLDEEAIGLTQLNLYGINQYGHEILMTVDHIKPLSKGGSNDMSNMQPMCENCNRAKGDKYEIKKEIVPPSSWLNLGTKIHQLVEKFL